MSSLRKRWMRAGLPGLGLAVVVALVAAEVHRVRDAAPAYLYGVPLVLMDLTRAHAAQTIGPENVLRRVRLHGSLPCRHRHPPLEHLRDLGVARALKQPRHVVRGWSTPPANLGRYGADDVLIANPWHRHAVGDRDALVFQADGSLDLWIQAEPPPPERQSNWLPVEAGQPFLLNARLYFPRPSALGGSWGLPAIERLEASRP